VATAEERRMMRMRPTPSLPQPGSSPSVNLSWAALNRGKPSANVIQPTRVPTVGTPPKPAPKKKKAPKAQAQILPAAVDRSQVLPAQPVGTPPGVVRAASQFLAGQAGIAQRFRESDVARRQALSAGLIGSMQSAADIYGGRAPALLGQFVTGQQRQAVQQASANLQTRAAEEQALAQAYAQALGEQYGQYGQRALDEARRRSEMVSQIRSIGA